MLNIVNKIYENTDNLGNELNIGDAIMFTSSGIHIYGDIIDIIDGGVKQKYLIKATGFGGDPSLRSKIKKEYKVNCDSKTIFKINYIKK